jgi:hypothetical protein
MLLFYFPGNLLLILSFILNSFFRDGGTLLWLQKFIQKLETLVKQV